MPELESWIVLLGNPDQRAGTATPVGPFDSEDEARAWVKDQPDETQRNVLGVLEMNRPDVTT